MRRPDHPPPDPPSGRTAGQRPHSPARLCRAAWVLTAFLAVLAPARAAWTDDLDALLKTNDPGEQTRLVESIAAQKPDWREVIGRIQNATFTDVARGTALSRTLLGADGVKRPYALYVPGSYDPKRPTPMLVWLHGAVTRPDLPEDPEIFATQHLASRLAEREGWICLYPLGQEGATWWDAVGMANIRAAVRNAKRLCNVDDDRVWLAGFSDGASGAYLAAMTDPNDYGAFVALNGHPGAGSLIGKIPAYLPNMASRPVYAVTTDRDDLFPSRKMQEAIFAAGRAGADILYRQLEGTHELTYWADEAPRIVRFLERHPRDPLPTRIAWEASDPHFGRRDWLAIDSVTGGRRAAWHQDVDPVVQEVHASLGIVPDLSYTDGGVPVRSVQDGSPAYRAGIRAGDILVRSEGTEFRDANALTAFESGLTQGGDVPLVYRRGRDEQAVTASVPAPQQYPLLFRDKPSAMVRATFAANRIEIEGSRLGAFHLFVHPDMVRLEQPLIVKVNGKTVYNARVEPDLAFLLRNFLENRDRRAIYLAEIRLEG